MFGFGWGELVVIGIVALIAIGPKELPTVLRTLGLWMGKVRRMANEFQGQFQEALREAELTDLQKHAEDLTTDLTKFGTDTQQEMEKSFAFGDPMKEAETASAAPAETATPAAEALPSIDVPLPELPPPVTEKDFAPAAPPAVAEPAPASEQPPQESSQEPPKQAGGGA